ncbi:hypothetical protein K439DRAFT_1665114 [Ramaria rubella]|nr:hypothetical protein K439DRAFT_1665114 [Ramaria rubella]
MPSITHARHLLKRQSEALNPGCTSGAFYISPKAGDNIDTSQLINIAWDPSLDCFTSQGIDIYLYAPYAANSMLHAWGGVSYSAGSFQTTLSGSWWNSSTTAIPLQIGFVSSNNPTFLSPVPPGPIFTSTFNATDFALNHPTGAIATPNTTTPAPGAEPSSSASSDGGGFFQVIGNAYRKAGLPKGSIAAAVLLPLLGVALVIMIFIRMQRKREAAKRQRWNQAVDKRMSALSPEWKGVPPPAQSEAIRQSIAIMRNSRASVARMSQLEDKGVRKSIGVGLREPAVGAGSFADRKSTISFAASTRFSTARPSSGFPDLPVPGEHLRTSRSFHTTTNATHSEDEDIPISPTQLGGPATVHDADLKQLELEFGPALSMMHNTDDPHDILLLAHAPLDASNAPITAPPATYLPPASATPYTPAYETPGLSFSTPTIATIAPDSKLRAYASRTSSPAPRTLYTPGQERGAAGEDTRYSVGEPDEEDEEDAYGGTAV